MPVDILPKVLRCKDHCPLLDRLESYHDPAAAAAGDAGDEVKEGDFNVQKSMRNKHKI